MKIDTASGRFRRPARPLYVDVQQDVATDSTTRRTCSTGVRSYPVDRGPFEELPFAAMELNRSSSMKK